MNKIAAIVVLLMASSSFAKQLVVTCDIDKDSDQSDYILKNIKMSVNNQFACAGPNLFLSKTIHKIENFSCRSNEASVEITKNGALFTLYLPKDTLTYTKKMNEKSGN